MANVDTNNNDNHKTLWNVLNRTTIDCAYKMRSGEQTFLLTVHIKIKLKRRLGQLITWRKSTYPEMKHLLNLHFGDSTDH